MFLKKALAVGILVAPILALNGCGGDNSTAGSNPNAELRAASFTLALTDGPVDTATAVVIEITGVSIKPKGGEAIVVEFETPRSIDLLQLQDGVVTDLVKDLDLQPGDYEWVRLSVNAKKDEVLDSYVEFADGTTVELDLPGESENGLRITRRFTLVEGEEATFTIDFDLRKSLIRRAGHVMLKPVLHMIPNRHAGHLRGDLDPALVAELCADPAASLGAVYVYSGANAMPTDVNGGESDPVASALVKLAPHGEYHYRIGFLEAGEYTVAYTCDAASDNPDEVNELTFAILDPIKIEARKMHEHPFPPHLPHEKWDESVCDRITSETPSEEESADGEAAEPTVRPIPPHLKRWCENGEHEWHPLPGQGGNPPKPPMDGPGKPTIPDNAKPDTDEEEETETTTPSV